MPSACRPLTTPSNMLDTCCQQPECTSVYPLVGTRCRSESMLITLFNRKLRHTQRVCCLLICHSQGEATTPYCSDFLFSLFHQIYSGSHIKHPVWLLHIWRHWLSLDQKDHTHGPHLMLSLPSPKLGVIWSLPHSKMPSMESGATYLASWQVTYVIRPPWHSKLQIKPMSAGDSKLLLPKSSWLFNMPKAWCGCTSSAIQLLCVLFKMCFDTYVDTRMWT